MTTQAELDTDLLAVLDQHLASRRDLLKKVKAELMALPRYPQGTGGVALSLGDVEDVMTRLIEEAKLPDGN